MDDVLCLNPGQYTKASALGSFAELTVHPLHMDSMPADRVSHLPNLLEKRTRVDILQMP